ncbi:MAG: PAS domain S-box protein, partial [Chitinispirillaceae bacterium]|nr:PAS domain S-box protein [Chitinispirillaceae bacterium]
MSIKYKILIGAAILCFVLVVFVMMNANLHRQVLANLSLRDQVQRERAVIDEFIAWKNDVQLQIAELVSNRHAAGISIPDFDEPPETLRDEVAALVTQGRILVDLAQEREAAASRADTLFEAKRTAITDLYRKLDKKISTTLAVLQMEQVLGTDVSEEASLAPYVLKSLNQLTLIALNSLVLRRYSVADRETVAFNRRFLSKQLHMIDKDGSMTSLFDALIENIGSLEQLIPETQRRGAAYEGRIAAEMLKFDSLINECATGSLVHEAEIKVEEANERLEAASRRTSNAAMLFLLGVPLLVLAGGLYGLDRSIIHPIISLQKALADFEKGRLDARVPVRSHDEIGVLARSFNEMAGQIHDKVCALDTLNRDLTEKGNKLHESELRLQAILESNANPIMVISSGKKVFYCNPAFTEVFGWASGELQGRMMPFVFENKHIAEDPEFSVMIAQGTPVRFIDKLPTMKGAQRDMIVGAAPIKYDNDTNTAIVLNFTDITEQRSLEEQLVQAQKMESVGRLAGGVAHDFNNMLGVIIGSAEMALEKIDAHHDVARDLSQILSAAGRSADITRQLLAFSRKQAIAPRSVNLNTTVENMLKMLARLIGEDIRLEWVPGEEVWPVFMDPTQIDQIMINLCVNARDALRENGCITISTAVAVIEETF